LVFFYSCRPKINTLISLFKNIKFVYFFIICWFKKKNHQNKWGINNIAELYHDMSSIGDWRNAFGNGTKHYVTWGNVT
jgi:hypothetical protein